MKNTKKFSTKIKKFFKTLGPGIITGASDDDPSGIATYSQAGAKFGFATLWTTFLTFPLMAGIQEMCASGAKGFTPAYSVWDFNATLKTTSFFTIRTGINNIFNKQYFTKRLHFILAPVYGQVMDEMFMQL